MNILPPPVFKYDVADMEGLEKKIFRWSDRKKLPENMTVSWSHMEMEIPSQPL